MKISPYYVTRYQTEWSACDLVVPLNWRHFHASHPAEVVHYHLALFLSRLYSMQYAYHCCEDCFVSQPKNYAIPLAWVLHQSLWTREGSCHVKSRRFHRPSDPQPDIKSRLPGVGGVWCIRLVSAFRIGRMNIPLLKSRFLFPLHSILCQKWYPD